MKYAAPVGSPYVLDLLEASHSLDSIKTHKRCKDINRNFNRRLETICEKIGIPRISMMWARYQHSTDFRENGGSLEQLNLVMGHQSMKTNKGYDHSLQNQKIQDLTKTMNKGLNIKND